MSTISSKSVKRHDPVDFLSIVVFLVLAITVMVVPFTANIYNSPNALAGGPASPSTAGAFVFMSDLKYWNTNCSHGWTGDSTCSEIVARTQSCASSVDSVYCSEYANYLKNFAE